MMLTDKNNGAGFGKTIAKRMGVKTQSTASTPSTQPPPKNIIAIRLSAVREAKAAQSAKDVQGLKPEDAGDTSDVAGAERQTGAMQADAHSDGHGSIAAAVTARRASSRPDEVDSTE